jgi:hypothetical protein
MTSDPGSTPPTGPLGPGSDGAATTDRTQRIDALAAYFRTNRDAFTQDALRQSAASAGYDPRDIDAAWAVSAEPAATLPASSRAVSALVALVYVVGTYASVVALPSNPALSDLAVPAVAFWLVVGILGWLLLRESRPAVAIGLRNGVIVAIVLPLVIFLVVLGFCLVMLAGGGSL